jgi:hypothetical protein
MTTGGIGSSLAAGAYKNGADDNPQVGRHNEVGGYVGTRTWHTASRDLQPH